MVKKLFIITLCLILYGKPSLAQTVNLNEALAIAKKHLNNIGTSTLKSGRIKSDNVRFKIARAEVENKDTLFYILNDLENNAFVIVSADERAWPILGYSTQRTFDEGNQPSAFKVWMEEHGKEIAYIKANNLQADEKTVGEWNQLKSATTTSQPLGVEPLLKTKWGQGCFYNELCPADPNGGCGHTPTGCVATAMAQIMKFWNFPTKGTGTKSYEYPNCPNGPYSADFGVTTYRWGQMPNEVKGSNQAVATLMYHCGVSVEMGYSTTESAPRKDIYEGLVNYFDYSKSYEFLERADFNSENWATLLKEELDLGYPIYYHSVGDPGHAFVCDGYQNNNYFHFNWGWDGNADGYFYIDNLNPNGSNFNQQPQAAMIKIRPNHLPDGFQGVFLSRNKFVLGPDEGNVLLSVTVNSSSDWAVISNPSWISVGSDKGAAGSSTLNIKTTINNTGVTRTAEIIVRANGFPDQQISIRQYAYTELNAGNLHNALSSELSSTTNLYLQGTIDARDFKTMRNEMPLLTTLDLRKAEIVAYGGTEGTAGNSFINYPANTIPDNAFNQPGTWQSNSLMKVLELPVSLEAIGNNAFFNCRGLKNIVLPPKVSIIGNSSFCNCRNLASVAFSASLRSIGFNSFMWCDHFYPETIPSSVVSIGDGAFSNVKGKIIVDAFNPNYSSLEGILYNKNKTVLINCPTSVVGSLIILPTVEIISSSAFLGDIYLTNVKFSDRLKKIEGNAFGSCTRLKTIEIPPSVNNIGAYAFENCFAVDTITSWKIRPLDFSKPFDLQHGSSSGVFANLRYDKAVLKVPFGTKAVYQSLEQWRDFQNIIEMPNQAPQANAGLNQTINEGSIITLDGSISKDPEDQVLSYKWTAPTGITLSSLTAQWPTFTAPEVKKDSTLVFTLVVNDGIVDSPPATVKVLVKNVLTVGINEVIDPGIEVYPNPTKGVVIISIDETISGYCDVAVYNSAGIIVSEIRVEVRNEIKIDLSDLIPGSYLLKVSIGNKLQTKMLIKQ